VGVSRPISFPVSTAMKQTRKNVYLDRIPET
jgi:hypothetical protein